jgi:hypothetical protein
MGRKDALQPTLFLEHTGSATNPLTYNYRTVYGISFFIRALSPVWNALPWDVGVLRAGNIVG